MNMRKLVAILVIMSFSSLAFAQQKRESKPVDPNQVIQPSVSAPENINGVRRTEVKQTISPDKVVTPSGTEVRNTQGINRPNQPVSTEKIQSPKKD